MNSIELFWDSIFSGNPERIRQTWQTLTYQQCFDVLQNLRRMKTETSWPLTWRTAAGIALSALNAK